MKSVGRVSLPWRVPMLDTELEMAHMIMLRWLFTRAFGLALTGTLAGASLAYANCSPVAEALDKAARQDRLAQYDVDHPEQTPSGRALVIRIGKTTWVDAAGTYDRSDSADADRMVSVLKKHLQDGKVQCEAAGNGTYAGQAAAKYRFESPMGGSSLGKVTFWVGKKSGLPLYHEFEKLGPGGFAWVYGNAVKEP
jgi:hypothetical protein